MVNRDVFFPHQVFHSHQGVIGVVQGVGQLIHSIIGLTVTIETHPNCDAEKQGETQFFITTHCWEMYLMSLQKEEEKEESQQN